MSTTPYLHCPQCGQSALHLATLCPRCKHPFDPSLRHPPAPRRRHRRIPQGVLIAAGLGAILALAAVQRELRLSFGSSTATPLAAEVVSPAPAPVAAQTQAENLAENRPAEPAVPEATPAALPTAQPVKKPAESAPAPAPVEPPAPAAPDAESGEQRYASTWVNVRARPSASAPVVRVLSPGDPVVVNSLRQGWYLAEVGGQTLGYVDRTLVRTDPDPEIP